MHEANGDILWNQRRQAGFMKVMLVMLGCIWSEHHMPLNMYNLTLGLNMDIQWKGLIHDAKVVTLCAEFMKVMLLGKQKPLVCLRMSWFDSTHCV